MRRLEWHDLYVTDLEFLAWEYKRIHVFVNRALCGIKRNLRREHVGSFDVVAMVMSEDNPIDIVNRLIKFQKTRL